MNGVSHGGPGAEIKKQEASTNGNWQVREIDRVTERGQCGFSAFANQSRLHPNTGQEPVLVGDMLTVVGLVAARVVGWWCQLRQLRQVRQETSP